MQFSVQFSGLHLFLNCELQDQELCAKCATLQPIFTPAQETDSDSDEEESEEVAVVELGGEQDEEEDEGGLSGEDDEEDGEDPGEEEQFPPGSIVWAKSVLPQ